MSKSIEMESGLVIAQGWGDWRHGEWLLNGSKVSLGDGENVLKLIVMAAQFCEDTENHWIIEFKGWIVWYIDYIPINLLLTKGRDLWIRSGYKHVPYIIEKIFLDFLKM